MPLHFTPQEFQARIARSCAAMRAQGLDGLLLFRQESMFWLTGYDGFGFVFFQCLVLTADGRTALLTRAPDLRVARYTSTLADIRVWKDAPDAEPASALRVLLAEYGLAGARLGVEWDSYGLTARNGQRLAAVMDGFCRLEDASLLITRLRMVKSAEEIAVVRRAAAIADQALAAALPEIRPGAFEGDILAALQGAVFRADGDYSGNEFIIGSGPAAHLGRYIAGRRHLAQQDQLTIEFAGVYRRYHSCLMRTFAVGATAPKHVGLHEVALEALAACRAALHPGRPIGTVYDAYAATLDRHGHTELRLNATGYGLGCTFAPNWMDWPMVYSGNPVPLEPGMVIFLHMAVTHGDFTAAPGETFLVTESGAERLGSASLSLQAEATA